MANNLKLNFGYIHTHIYTSIVCSYFYIHHVFKLHFIYLYFFKPTSKQVNIYDYFLKTVLYIITNGFIITFRAKIHKLLSYKIHNICFNYFLISFDKLIYKEDKYRFTYGKSNDVNYL